MHDEDHHAYDGSLSQYAECHQLSLGLALGLAGPPADRLLVAALWAALGDDRGVPSRLLVELQAQPHYLASGYALGRLLRWYRSPR